MAYCRLFLVCVIVVLSTGLSTAIAVERAWAMRPRVFCNSDWGIAFRYPYAWRAPDQYAAAVRGGGMGGMSVKIDPNKKMTPEQLRELFKKRIADAKVSWDARGFSWSKDELPSDVDLKGKSLEQIASLLVKEYLSIDVTFEAADYYETDNELRPHADPDWAMEGITAVKVADGSTFCGWFCDIGDRYAGVLCKGSSYKEENQLVMDSFEVLKPQRRGSAMTWRHAQAEKGYVIGPAGLLVKAKSYRGDKNVEWSAGWDVESEHYHLRVQSHPAKALYLSAYLDKLYEAFIAVYDPDTVPPYKMEIQVFDTQRNFMTGAGAHGIPVGPTVGGFFLPGHLAIFAYEDSVKISPDFSVEHVLAHECSHQFLHATCNGSRHVPTWINEGMAVYFESAKYDGRKFSWHPPKQRLDRLIQVYNFQKRPLAGLDYYMNHYGHISPTQYAEVYAILHFFVFGVKSGKKRFKEYWQALKNGEDGTKAFKRIFMEDMIKANGGEDGALRAFNKALLQYVTHKGKPAYKQGG